MKYEAFLHAHLTEHSHQTPKWAPLAAKCKCVLGLTWKLFSGQNQEMGQKPQKSVLLFTPLVRSKKYLIMMLRHPLTRDNTALANLDSTCLQCLLKTLTYCKGLECSAPFVEILWIVNIFLSIMKNWQQAWHERVMAWHEHCKYWQRNKTFNIKINDPGVGTGKWFIKRYLWR